MHLAAVEYDHQAVTLDARPLVLAAFDPLAVRVDRVLVHHVTAPSSSSSAKISSNVSAAISTSCSTTHGDTFTS